MMHYGKAFASTRISYLCIFVNIKTNKNITITIQKSVKKENT